MSDATPNPPLKFPDPTAGVRSSPTRWRVVGVLWFCGFFNYADRQAVYAVFPLLKDEFHVNQETLGLVGTWFSPSSMRLAALFAGLVIDRDVAGSA